MICCTVLPSSLRVFRAWNLEACDSACYHRQPRLFSFPRNPACEHTTLCTLLCQRTLCGVVIMSNAGMYIPARTLGPCIDASPYPESPRGAQTREAEIRICFITRSPECHVGFIGSHSHPYVILNKEEIVGGPGRQGS